MRNHITALSLSAALVLTLTACGGGSAAPSYGALRPCRAGPVRHRLCHSRAGGRRPHRGHGVRLCPL